MLVSRPVENQKRPWSAHVANLARAAFWLALLLIVWMQIFGGRGVEKQRNAAISGIEDARKSRVIAMINRYCDGVVPGAAELTAADLEIEAVARRATEGSWQAIERLAIHEAIAEVWQLVDALNGYLTSEEPWALAKDPEQRGRLETVLAIAYRGLGALAVLLSPVLPKATAKLWTALGAPGEVTAQRIDRAHEAELGERVAPLEALFPRVEVGD